MFSSFLFYQIQGAMLSSVITRCKNDGLLQVLNYKLFLRYTSNTMKKFITLAALFAVSMLFFSCRTLKEIPEDKTSAQIIQMGQNYVSYSDYKSAEFCYETVIDRYGTDPAIYVEARYELGRIYLAQKKYDKAYATFNEVLTIYDSYAAVLPGSYKKLCNISINQIPAAKLAELQK